VEQALLPAGAPASGLPEAERRLLSAALAAAVKEVFPGAVRGSCGTMEHGFFHDFLLERPFDTGGLACVESAMRRILAAAPAKAVRLSAGEALRRLTDEPLLRDEVEAGGWADETLVRIGAVELVVNGAPSAVLPEGRVFRLTGVSGAYWRGDEKQRMLTRVSGLAFASQADGEAHERRVAEARKRDHRVLGRDLGLFVISERVGRGLPMLAPRGAAIRQALERFIVDEEAARGYEVVYTPVLGRRELYETSGHLAHYGEAMFPAIRLDDQELILRPMTCPHHFMLYRSLPHSWREMPVRYAEISPLYRRERSGELYGLARVLAFHLADSHIMCRPDQVAAELDGVLDLVRHVMTTLGLQDDCSYRASLREPGSPAYEGPADLWDRAEAALLAALARRGLPHREAAGEAAFYGPKIDVQMKTAGGREETLFTIQVDFVLPERFELEYVDSGGRAARPVVIHRSSVGCLERTIAFLLEKYAGALPPWLAPVQVRLLPVGEACEPYARELLAALRARRLRAEVDARAETLGRRIRDARRQLVPYVAVVGPREVASRAISVRNRDTGGEHALAADGFVEGLLREVDGRFLQAAI
jgi:threonyl-tRNA synthetase